MACEVSVLLIATAFTVPVAGIEVRPVRTAYEFVHNTSRFQPKQVVPGHLAERPQVDRNAPAIFRALWWGRQILESEHREWLSLTIEAEWFE
jgi:hypothetical protein